MAREPVARKRRGASKSAGRQVPGWVWMFTGVVTGLFIAFLVHLAQLRASHPENTGNPVAHESETPAAKPDKEGKKPRFDFYAVLPKMEVILPKDDNDQGGSESTSTGRKPKSAHTTADENASYMLQAGSFRGLKDADQRRAGLILQGYQARVQTVELDSGENWHRVMVGPFNDMDAMHDAQDKLAGAGIETLPIRARKEQ